MKRWFTVADRSAFDALRKWADHSDDRYFEIRCLAQRDADHPWSVRVECETTGWSHTEDAHESLGRAVGLALKAALDEGLI